MKTILLTNKYTNKPLEIIESVCPDKYRLVMLDEITQKDLVMKVPTANYILASGRLRINEEVLNQAENLQMIQRTGVGLDSLDMDAIKAKNIPLYVNQGVNADSVAEHAVLMMLACLRKLTVINRDTQKGIWEKQIQGTSTRTLRGRTVGIIGMGNIGKAVAKLLLPFGVNLIYYDRLQADWEAEKKLGIHYVELSELFAKADIISLHCALTKESKYLINKQSLGKMQDGVIIVNTARGQLICENDLIEALKCGKVRFAGLDVYEHEPLVNPDLINVPNIITTPHIAGVTYDAFYQMMNDAMRNIRLFDEGRLQEINQFCFNFDNNSK